MYSIKPGAHEAEHQYLWRLGQAKDARLTDASWNEIAAQMRAKYGTGGTGETVRRRYQIAREFERDGVFGPSRQIVLEKERQVLQAERAAYRRVIRDAQRRETFAQTLARAVSGHVKPLAYKPPRKTGATEPCDMIVSLTDLHTGVGIDNFAGRFDDEVLRDRFRKYLDEILSIQQRHGAEDAYVIVSEILSGLIHPTLRIEQNEDLVDQFVFATTLVAEFLAELSRAFRAVHAYVCPGNHSRMNAAKDLDIQHENLDNLVLYYLRAKLQNFPTIHMHDNDTEQSIAIFEVRGKLVYAAHGDRDKAAKAVERLTMFLGRKPDLIYLGHMHTNALLTAYDAKVIQSGCMSGSDDYCMSKRLRNRPEQTVSVVSKRGLECLYDIQLDEGERGDGA